MLPYVSGIKINPLTKVLTTLHTWKITVTATSTPTD